MNVRSVIVFILILCVASVAEAQLTLERAVALAVQRNERAAVAETTVEAAEARIARARTAFLPRVDINGSARAELDADDLLSTSALLTQPLFDARAFPLFRAARLERDATRYLATDTKRVLAYDAANAFVATLSSEQVLIAAENRRNFARTSLDDVRARFEAGLVSSNDVTRVELELATAERGVAQARGEVQSSRITLANIINSEVDGPLAVPAGLLDAADDAPSLDPTLVAAAQQRRPDVAATRTQVEALRAFADEPRARFFPTVGLSAQTRNINDGPISNRDNDGFVGVTFAWPVFDAGVRNAERAERLANVRGAELDLGLTLREVERQLRDAAAQLTTEQAALRESIAAVTAARKNADETGELYRQGLASALELADANRSLFDAEVAEATSRYRMAVAYLALREASGVEPVQGE
ncbi:MAG TPA: TolC family protein [Thermoanaerobaculia bacterium]